MNIKEYHENFFKEMIYYLMLILFLLCIVAKQATS